MTLTETRVNLNVFKKDMRQQDCHHHLNFQMFISKNYWKSENSNEIDYKQLYSAVKLRARVSWKIDDNEFLLDLQHLIKTLLTLSRLFWSVWADFEKSRTWILPRMIL